MDELARGVLMSALAFVIVLFVNAAFSLGWALWVCALIALAIGFCIEILIFMIIGGGLDL